MNKLGSLLLMAASVPAIGAAFYFVVPVFASPRASVFAEAGRHVERSRRLLMSYGENEARLADLSEQLAALGVSRELDAEDIDRLLPEIQGILEDAADTGVDENSEAVMRRVRQERQRRVGELEERYRALGGADDSPLSVGGRPPRANARSVREALRARQTLLVENERLLQEASAAVDEAIGVSSGDITGSDYPASNRLKGIILQSQASVFQTKAAIARLDAHAVRKALFALVTQVERLGTEEKLLEHSGIRDRIDSLGDRAEAVRREIRRAEELIQRLDATIADLKARIDGYRQVARAARTVMDGLEDRGVDLLDPEGSETFAREYAQVAEEYRKASANAHRLESGTLEGARIDDSGDYISGTFVPVEHGGDIVQQRGLIGYENDRATAAAELDGLTTTLADLQASITELEATAADYAQQVAATAEQASGIRDKTAALFAEFEQHVNEAEQNIDRGIAKARAATSAFRQASTAYTSLVRHADEAIQMADPTTQERSAHKPRSQDKWLAGQADNEAAQATLLLAKMLLDRFVSAGADLEFVRFAKESLELADADPAAYEQRRDTARTDATEAVQRVIDGLSRSARDLNNNWTIAAQAGSAHYMMALLDAPAHLNTAIGNYQNALDGANQNPSADAIADRLAQLLER